MSKAAEKAIIEKLEKAFDKNNNNYLASFFTRALTNWIDKQITIDGSADIMSYVEDYWNVKSENDTLKNRIEHLKVQHQAKRIEEIKLRTATCETYNERLNEANDENKALRESIQKDCNIMYEKQAHINLLESTVKLKDQEITALKVIIFDLDHPKK